VIVRAKLSLVGAALVLMAAATAQGAHTKVRFVLAAEAARPGETVLMGIHFQMDPRWHIYWKNPGQSGGAPTIDWQLPAGATTGAIQWPVPEKLTADDLTTYIYENEVLLFVPLKLAADLKPGTLNLKAKIKWLECGGEKGRETCVPESGSVETVLNIGSEAKRSEEAAFLETWKKRLPQKSEALAARARWEGAAKGDLRPLILEWVLNATATEADFFPEASEQFEIQPATERIPTEAGKVGLRAQVKKLLGDWPKEISGFLIQSQKGGQDRTAYEVSLPITNGGTAAAGNGGPAKAEGTTASLWQKLAYAFIGGLILNIMPCVLPVIALKILGFVSQAKDEPARVRKLGLIYGLGVLVSFLGMAIVIMVLKAAGSKAGWGFQFTNPYFVVGMTVLVALIALNLFGVFEITLGSGTLTAATGLASKHGATGAFFNGLLATVLATSCSAPYLAAAVGFAFKETSLMIVIIMLTVGLGLAAPYLVLSWNPAWLKFLPKPGAWMEKFKIAMGFPMLAAAVWLCSIATLHYGDRTWWLALFLIFVAVAAWVYGEFIQRGRKHRLLAGLFTAALLVVGYFYALEHELQWREPISATAQEGGPKVASRVAPRGLDWQKWSPEAVASARSQGRPVLVDFTATWCPTCNTVIKHALEDASVVRKVKEVNALSLVADYSLQPPDIGAELDRFGRRAVPLVVVYSRKAEASPKQFDYVTAGDLLDALSWAAQ
jgi:thiol:disulfide interchange protein DsbD